jgi:flagellar hook-associated protein 1 FlgK
MVSLSNALRIANSGIQTSQIGLGTIAQNVTNVNTPGFSRQSAEFSAVSFNGFGNGVELLSIQRQVDRFLNARIINQISVQGFEQARIDRLTDIETVFGNPLADGGIDKVMNSLFTELSTLANQTDSSAQKRNTVQQGVLVADTLRNVNTELDTTQARIDDQLDDAVVQLNSVLRNIHELNQQISAQELGSVNGANANDLRDSRQQQINILAENIGINVSDTASGAVRITTEDGRGLIDTATYSQLERTTGTPFQGIGIRRILVNDQPANNTLTLNFNNIASGKLKALIDVRDTTIPNLLSELNQLTNTFKNEFNRLHSAGSSFPPVNSLTSGNTSGLGTTGSDLLTTGGLPGLAGNQFNISVVDSTGDTVVTTQVTGLTITGTGPVTIPGTGPFSLIDLQDLINNNADIGVTALGAGLGVTATAGVDGNGQPIITMQASDPNLRIVLSNATGDALGTLGMNNFFTGTNSDDINVRADIRANPGLVATARMRASDAGLSSLDNRNVLELAKLSDTELSFSAAGSLGAQTDTAVGYAVQMISNFSVTLQDSQDRADFADNLLFELKEQESSLIGVNLDEELSQMLVFQQSFQASARIIRTVDDLMQFLIQTIL